MERPSFPQDDPHTQTGDGNTSSATKDLLLDPSWEKWRKEQVQTISTLLSNIFKMEDDVRQIQAPSRLLRNPARQSIGSEEEMYEKLSAIRQQISEYEQVLQLSRKRIDKVLQVIHPPDPPTAPPTEPAATMFQPKPPSRIRSLKKWMKRNLANPFLRKKRS